MSDIQDPLLLEPELLRAPGPFRNRPLALLGLLASVTLAAVWGLGGQRSGEASAGDPLARYAAPAGSVVAIIPANDESGIEDALSRVVLEPSRLAQLREEVGTGVTRLGVARVWDWADSDGDEVSISSAGYRQTISISGSPVIVVVPVGSDQALSLAPARDGLGGGVTAMIEAAANYLGGRGVEADSIKALEYALRAAGQGSPEGDLLAGNLYMLQYGIGMQKDLGLAVRFLEKALAQQRVEAALVLGSIYTSIAKEPEWHDPARGAAYFQQCAAALVPACLFAYGQTLEAGSGVARDSVGAYAYFALAREGGVPRAECRLAVLATALSQADRQLAVERARQIISQNSRAARSAILSPMWQ